MTAVALVSWAVHVASAMLIAILLGVLLRNFGMVRPGFEQGIALCSKRVLRLGVVLLGLRLSIPQVLSLGGGMVAVIVLCVTVTMVITVVCGRLLRVAHTATILTASGTAICGASAVAGVSAVTLERSEGDEDVEDAAATAIATVTLYGTLALLLLPALAIRIGLDAKQIAVWLGSSIHEVGQVVAAGSAVPAEVGDVATVTKLGRIACLAFVIAIVGIVEKRRAVADGDRCGIDPSTSDATSGGRNPMLPAFVVGFLVAVLLVSFLGDVAGFSQVFRFLGDEGAGWLLTLAMAAMGAGVRFRRVVGTGARALSRARVEPRHRFDGPCGGRASGLRGF